MAIVYIDGTSLNDSTAVYTDAALTVYAAAGFYSDGVIVREQTITLGVGSLSVPQPCPNCLVSCGSDVSSSGGQGFYNVDVDVSVGTGAIIITFNPNSVPEGVKVLLDTTTYNKMSSPVFGKLQSSIAGNPTYVGVTTSDCGISGTTYPTLAEYSYIDGSFYGLGTTQSVTVNAGDVNLTATQPGDCVMVIPKPSATTATIYLDIISPCGTGVFDVNVSCPTALTGVWTNGTPVGGGGSAACVAVGDTTYYHVPVNTASTAGVVNLHDYLFQDANGSVAVTDGWYLMPQGYRVQTTDGIVTNVLDNCATLRIDDCKTGDVYTMNDRFGTNTIGDVIQYQIQNNITGPDGVTRCGTVTAQVAGEDTNAFQVSDTTYACSDAVNCP